MVGQSAEADREYRRVLRAARELARRESLRVSVLIDRAKIRRNAADLDSDVHPAGASIIAGLEAAGAALFQVASTPIADD